MNSISNHLTWYNSSPVTWLCSNIWWTDPSSCIL